MNPALVMTMPPLPPKDDSTAPRASSSRASFESFMSEGGEDIFMTIETHDGSEFVAIEQPRTTFDRKGSLQKEKQISVDPISLNAPPLSIRQASFRLVSPPSSTPKSLSYNMSQVPLPQPPPRLKFVSASLPGSASLSPKSSASLLKKIWRNENEVSPGLRGSHIYRQRSTMDDTQLAFEESNMRRSKSMREGRSSVAPTDDFELWLEKPDKNSQEYSQNHGFSYNKGTNHHFGFGKNGSSRNGSRKISKNQLSPEDKFNKCGKLCLFLPRGKGKPLRSSSSTSTTSVISAISGASSAQYSTTSTQMTQDNNPTISRTVSMEIFKCGSWSSAALLNNYEYDNDEDATNLFFDLPFEMIRCSVSDMQSPVSTAFLFDKDAKSIVKEPTKGVLKTSSSTASNIDGVDGRKSRSSSQDNSTRHVRFSTASPTSSPTCITPRLRKARDEFNAFLEAQNAFI